MTSTLESKRNIYQELVASKLLAYSDIAATGPLEVTVRAQALQALQVGLCTSVTCNWISCTDYQ